MHLPLRSEVIVALKNEWSKSPELSVIEDVTMHYLAGEISVEASMPIEKLASVESSKTVQTLFEEACLRVPCVQSATLRFH